MSERERERESHVAHLSSSRCLGVVSNGITLLPTLLSRENVPLRQHTFHWRFHHMPTDMGNIFLGNNCYRLLSQVDPRGKSRAISLVGFSTRLLQKKFANASLLKRKDQGASEAGWPLGWSTLSEWRSDLGIHQAPKVTPPRSHHYPTIYPIWGCQVLNLTTFRCERFRKFFFKKNSVEEPKMEQIPLAEKPRNISIHINSPQKHVLGSFFQMDGLNLKRVASKRKQRTWLTWLVCPWKLVL